MDDPNQVTSDKKHAALTQHHVDKLAAAFGMSTTPGTLREELKAKLQAICGLDHQRAAAVGNALDAAHAAIDELAAKGFPFQLAEGVASTMTGSPQEWPKMLYQNSGEAKVFDAPPTEKDGGPWFEHPTERPTATEASPTPLAKPSTAAAGRRS